MQFVNGSRNSSVACVFAKLLLVHTLQRTTLRLIDLQRVHQRSGDEAPYLQQGFPLRHKRTTILSAVCYQSMELFHQRFYVSSTRVTYEPIVYDPKIKKLEDASTDVWCQLQRTTLRLIGSCNLCITGQVMGLRLWVPR